MKILRSFLDLFLRSPCPLCDRPSGPGGICLDCDRQLQHQRFSAPAQGWGGELPVFVWGQYGHILKRAIATMKYQGHPPLGQLLGSYLGQSWCQNRVSSSPLVVVPIPLHGQKEKQRGFNQAAAIAQGFCGVTGYPLELRGLQRIKPTQALFALKPQERQQEIKDAFRLGHLAHRRPRQGILLIDDIYTTGSTAREVQRLLRAHRLPLTGIAAIASSQLPDFSPSP